jgi:site-specific recombinase XerC
VKLSILAVLILTGVDTAEKKIKFLGKGMHKRYVKEQN